MLVTGTVSVQTVAEFIFVGESGLRSRQIGFSVDKINISAKGGKRIRIIFMLMILVVLGNFV